MADSPLCQGQHCYRLPDPYGQLPYLPMDAVELAERLGVSYRTALRICTGERPISKAHVVYLQVMLFGYIPDPELMRGLWYFRDGSFLSHRLPGHEFPASEILESALLRYEYLRTASELDEARRRIDELTSPPKPTNIIDFKKAASMRNGSPFDGMGA